jgi:hypothetical protein
VNVFAATLRTLELAFFVFVERKDDFKWLFAIFTVELIARHVDLRGNSRVAGLLYLGLRLSGAGVKASNQPAATSIRGRPAKGNFLLAKPCPQA